MTVVGRRMARTGGGGIVLAGLLLHAGCVPGSGRTSDAAPPLALVQRIDGLVADAIGEGPQPGASVAVASHGNILLARGYGLADVATSVRAKVNTVYRIGSVTKQFTAAAVMDLVEQGRLGVDDDITEVLPDYPTGGRRVTLRHLLTHTSGIREYTELPEFRPIADRSTRRDDLVKLFAGQFDFPPGQQWAYSNSNYYLLGLVVEKAGGMAYGRYLAERIFAPMYMGDTGLCPDEPAGRRQAKGYQLGSDGTPQLSEPLNMEHAFAAGGLCSTVEDLARWNDAFHGHRFLTAASYELMTSPVRLADGTTRPYGFGLELDGSTGAALISHGGAVNGFLSWLAYAPGQRLTVVVLVNSGSSAGDGLVQEVMRATHRECGAGADAPHLGPRPCASARSARS